MSWVQAVQVLVKADALNREMDNVTAMTKLANAVQKKDHKKLKPQDFRPFSSSAMDRVIKQGEQVRKTLDKIIASKSVKWPSEDKVQAAYAKMVKAQAEHGKDSKEMKAALQAYVKAVQMAMVELFDIQDPLKEAETRAAQSLRAAEALGKAAKVLAAAFEKCTRIPAVGGISPPNIFGPLVLDAYEVENVASSVGNRLEQILKINDKHLSECDELLENAKSLLKWAGKHSAWKNDELERKSDNASLH